MTISNAGIILEQAEQYPVAPNNLQSQQPTARLVHTQLCMAAVCRSPRPSDVVTS